MTRIHFLARHPDRAGFPKIALSAALMAVLAVSQAGPGFAQDTGTTHGTHTDGTHDDGSHDDGSHSGSGQGGAGQGAGAGGQGPKGPGTGEGGRVGQTGDDGRPVWAGGGIPEVELGRLNVARSPDRVIDRAYDEALARFTPAVAQFYDLTLDQMDVVLRTNWDSLQMIDSPLQNLALLRDAMSGQSILETKGIGESTETLMAAFLGTASDKAMPITKDTALAISIILGHPLTDAAAAALAVDAERIRQAIVAGHG